MFFNKQIFFIQSPPIQNSKFPHPPCATHFGKLSKFAKVFFEHHPQVPHLSIVPQIPLVPKVPKVPSIQNSSHRTFSEGSAKDERRISEG